MLNMDNITIIAILSFIAILILLIVLRLKNSSIEVKSTDVVVAIIPIVVFLLVSGKLQKFEIGEGGLKLETAFVNASKSAIASQINQIAGLPITAPRAMSKGGVSEIPRLIAGKTEALIFRLGGGNYWGPAIAEYFDKLSSQSYFKYVIIENPDRTFYAISDARELEILFKSHDNQISPDAFADWINNNDKAQLSKLPGFISFQDALSEKSDKTQALSDMEKHNSDILPVIDENKHLKGVVERSRLTASLLVDIAQELK